MTTPYIDPNLIFAENAPTQDKPAAFSNYDKGWDESRNNDGRPLIPQMNYLTQQADLKNLYIHENGAALPYKDGITYEEDAVVVKDGVLQQWKGGGWVNATEQIATIPDIFTLKNYTPRKNDQIVEVIDYDANVQGIFNKYIYRASPNLADNYGTVIASDVVAGRWVMLPKSAYIPEDFGVASGATFVPTNTERLTAYIQSGLNLFIPPKKYIGSAGFVSFTITKPTTIVGASLESSILERVRIILSVGADGSVLKNFRVNTLTNNYSIYNVGANYVTYEKLHTYDNYDGIAFYSNVNKMKGCVVRDCISERSRRVAFTVDIGAEDTLLENNIAIDSRQGFHFEGDVRSTALKSKTIRCGLGSPTGVGEQDGYAGALRSYGTNNLTIDGFENIDQAGVGNWQHGGASGGSFNLVFKNFKGIGNLILDDSIETTTNMHFENITDNFGIYRSNNKQILQGRIVVRNVVGAVDLMIGGSTTSDVYLEDAKVGRILINCGNLFLHNVQGTTQYNHGLSANNIVGTGLLENNQTTYQETNGGFNFDMSTCERILLETLKLRGVSGGSHLSFTNLNRATTKKINLGEYMPDTSLAIRINGATAFQTVDFVKYNIRYNDAQRVYKANAIPTVGIFQVGDVVYKSTVAADMIYGWICTIAGTDAAAVWKPLKYAV